MAGPPSGQWQAHQLDLLVQHSKLPLSGQARALVFQTIATRETEGLS